MKKKLLAIIPARIGSKRLKEKNLRKLGGKDLVSWTIDFAKKTKLFHTIFVSTDSVKIKRIAVKKKCFCPVLRPIKISNDKSNLVDVCIYIFNYLEKKNLFFDSVVLLQPTSPFRLKKTLLEAINKFYEYKKKYSVISIAEVKKNPYSCVIIKRDYLKPFLKKHGLNKQSQMLPKVYAPNGSIYISSIKNLKKNKSFFSYQTKFVKSYYDFENIDIDNLSDLKLAKNLIKYEKKVYKN